MGTNMYETKLTGNDDLNTITKTFGHLMNQHYLAKLLNLSKLPIAMWDCVRM